MSPLRTRQRRIKKLGMKTQGNESKQPDEEMEIEKPSSVTPVVDGAGSGGQECPVVLTEGEDAQKDMPVDVEEDQETPITHAEEPEDEEPTMDKKKAVHNGREEGYPGKGQEGKGVGSPTNEKEDSSRIAVTRQGGLSRNLRTNKCGAAGSD